MWLIRDFSYRSSLVVKKLSEIPQAKDFQLKAQNNRLTTTATTLADKHKSMQLKIQCYVLWRDAWKNITMREKWVKWKECFIVRIKTKFRTRNEMSGIKWWKKWMHFSCENTVSQHNFSCKMWFSLGSNTSQCHLVPSKNTHPYSHHHRVHCCGNHRKENQQTLWLNTGRKKKKENSPLIDLWLSEWAAQIGLTWSSKQPTYSIGMQFFFIL